MSDPQAWRAEIADHARHKGTSGYTRVTCPACPERHGSFDRKKSVSVNLSNGWWKCWRCEFRGRLPGFDSETYDDDDGWEDVDPEIELPSDYALLSGGSVLLEQGRDYLRRRGITQRTWTDARIGYARRGVHAGRLIMPTDIQQGPEGGWVGRTILPGVRPPYHTAKGFHRDSFFGAQALRDPDLPFVVLVEGPMDALALWPWAVACLGKPTERQLGHLARRGSPVVVVLDGDAKADGVAASSWLQVCGVRSQALVLPPHADPAEVGKGSILQAAWRWFHGGDMDETS